MGNGSFSVNEEGSDLGKAAERGNPSFVWRAGQERRLAMVREWVSLAGQRVLDVGAGVGMYTTALGRHAARVVGVEVELDRARDASREGATIVQAVGEALPFGEDAFDVVFSHEVIEHVQDDARVVAEMVRVAAPGGRLVVFCPNRGYPFETHGHYWQGRYRFGNTPLINYLPDSLRDRLAPHVRAYSPKRLRALFRHLPVRILHHTQIYPGFDNLVARRPALGRGLRRLTYWLERTPLRILGISHFLVLEKTR
jgi:SAM-dependent methyltransferase